ncbi:hypothetical protein NQZ68_025855 [Dissostichus eleginoides]|nr:hypothetical protein NQZ68_025855 [Dissostichus eleginoides]
MATATNYPELEVEEINSFSDSDSIGDVNYTADTSEQHQQIQPYRFEPYLDELSDTAETASGSESDSEGPEGLPQADAAVVIEQDIGRLQNTEW